MVPTIIFHGDRDTTVHPDNGAQVVEQCRRSDNDAKEGASRANTRRARLYPHDLRRRRTRDPGALEYPRRRPRLVRRQPGRILYGSQRGRTQRRKCCVSFSIVHLGRSQARRQQMPPSQVGRSRRRAGRRSSFACKAEVIGIFGEQDISEKTRAGEAFGDWRLRAGI